VTRARLVLVATLAAACSKQTPTPTEEVPGDASPSVPAPHAPSVAAETSAPPSAQKEKLTSATKLLDAGQSPRQKLRYRWHLERKEELVLVLRTSATTSAGGLPLEREVSLPPVRITVDIDPRSVTPAGELLYDFRVTSSDVEPDAASTAAMTAGMRAEASAADHLQGSATVDARGLCESIEIDPASIADAGALGVTGQMVEQVRQTLRDLAAPLPEEEVGRGARWQKISEIDAKGSRLTQTDTFTLSEVHGDKGTLDDVLAQTAPSQALYGPGAPQAAPMRMESMLASGNARTLFELSHLVPQTKYDGTTTMVVSGPSGADSVRRVTMVMRVGIEIRPAAAPPAPSGTGLPTPVHSARPAGRAP
jgi:hypothetical protein